MLGTRSSASLFVTLLLAATGGGCGDDDTGADPDASTGGMASTTTGGGGTGSDGGASATAAARHERYCEVLIGYPDGMGVVRMEVWNTWTLNDCPTAAWEAIDPMAVADENMALLAVLNGPRYWTLDFFDEGAPEQPEFKTIGGIDFFGVADLLVPLDSVADVSAPYEESSVERTTTYRFLAGTMVHELVDPDGGVWVMQSYEGSNGPQTDAQLAETVAGLTPPAGWQARSRTLDADYQVRATGVARVLRDDADNTFQFAE
ncbi:MAG: hypothetical protein AAF928_15715 [Myxococcota bacterium]